MKQVLQALDSGETMLVDVPTPRVPRGSVLIKTSRSLVSLGTERMLVQFGQSGYLTKARQQPEKVKMILDKVRTDGLLPTIDSVRRKLAEPIPLGYSNAGVVVEVGPGVVGLSTGDRVVSNGSHAEFVVVPQNLCARIPDRVSDDEAAFTVVGAIGLQGIRLVNPTYGETVVVVGLGLIGLLSAQLLRANGCAVIGIEPDEAKRELASSLGIKSIGVASSVDSILEATDGIGADAVLITASAKGSDIVSKSALMSRKRGRIVLVGVVGLELSRADFYEKELTFQVSCSYGPGRYEPNYEQRGLDYPIAHVRWTEQRNFQAILTALEQKQLVVEPLVSERVPIDRMAQVYASIATSNSIATLFEYDVTDSIPMRTIEVSPRAYSSRQGAFGIIGAGNFTKMTVMPAFAKVNADVRWIVSSRGVSSSILANQYGVQFSSSDYASMLRDDAVGTVIVTTQHDTHHRFAVEAMKAGKDVFVEKPLVLTRQELDDLIAVRDETGRNITVGFNRRFSPHTMNLKKALGDSQKNLIATVNAGHIPPEVWVHDLERGGGRIVGEACHFIDLLAFLSGSEVTDVCANALGTHPTIDSDNVTILMRFANGDQGTVCYYSNGHKGFPKERIEAFVGKCVYRIDNFRKTTAFGDKSFRTVKTRLDKGHALQFELLSRSQREEVPSPMIPFEQLVNVTKASFAALESIAERRWVTV